jgi:hypothetical protein
VPAKRVHLQLTTRGLLRVRCRLSQGPDLLQGLLLLTVWVREPRIPQTKLLPRQLRGFREVDTLAFQFYGERLMRGGRKYVAGGVVVNVGEDE